MVMKRFLKITAAMFFMLSLSGCGSEGNSNTNGSLSLSAVAPVNGVGAADLVATATVTSAVAGKAVVGVDVYFVATQYGYNSSSGQYDIVVGAFSETNPTNSAGVAQSFHTFQPSQTMITVLQVTATCGGLRQSMTTPAIPMLP